MTVAEKVAGLTRSERETLELLAEGLSNKGIAARLVIQESSAEKRIASVFLSLGLYPADPNTNRRVLAVNMLRDRDVEDPYRWGDRTVVCVENDHDKCLWSACRCACHGSAE